MYQKQYVKNTNTVEEIEKVALGIGIALCAVICNYHPKFWNLGGE
jgi:hypothetical protein